MGQDSPIEWCDSTWNPVRGCSRVSPGCVNCYAEKVAARFSGPGLAYEGLAFRKLKVHQDGEEELASRWTGEVRMVPEHLADPLRWTRPRRIFVNSMSDLFHEKLSNENIAAVFGVMAAAPRHTFQVLTKRAERMREWFAWMFSCRSRFAWGEVGKAVGCAQGRGADTRNATAKMDAPPVWPLPNVWLGVSVEDQQRADERIPYLRATPAAIRFVSYEPALGPVDFAPHMWPVHDSWPAAFKSPEEARAAGATVTRHRQALVSAHAGFLDWIIVGGESGPGARPFDVAWARSVVQQCKAAGVACFVKQLGVAPFDSGHPEEDGEPQYPKLRSKKGGDMDEWLPDLRVREFPEARRG